MDRAQRRRQQKQANKSTKPTIRSASSTKTKNKPPLYDSATTPAVIASSLGAEHQQYQHHLQTMKKSPYISFPAHVHLETLARCNAACNFCPSPNLTRKGTVMDDALIEKVVSDLCDIPKQLKFQLSPFKVNEPFLDKRLFDLLDFFAEKLPNASLTLTSNASPITEKKLARLAKFKKLGYLWISFNDHREGAYETVMQLPYKRTIARLEMIHKAKAEGRFSIPVILSRVGDNSLVDSQFRQWIASRFPLFKSSVFARGNWLGQTEAAASPTPNVGCVRWFDVSITATGVVAHCCMDGNADYPIGNVRSEHVLEIYNKPEYRRLRESLQSRLDTEPCRDCSFL